MNPITSSRPAPSEVAQDVAPATNLDQAPMTPIKAELVDVIPVKNPDAAPGASPVNTTKPAASNPPRTDKAMDIILKDVTKAVKKPDVPSPKFAPPAKEPKNFSAAGPIIFALLVAGLLTAAAVYSYRSSAAATSNSHNNKEALSHAGY